MNKQQTGDRPQVTVTKEFGVPAEYVFNAWLDAEMLGRWMFGPEVRDEEIVKLETTPQKGGTFSFVVRRDGKAIHHLGTYLEIDRPNRLAFTWGIETESEEESVVAIDIVPTDKGCRLTLTHTLDPKWADYTDRTRAGWSHMLDKLKEIMG